MSNKNSVLNTFSNCSNYLNLNNNLNSSLTLYSVKNSSFTECQNTAFHNNLISVFNSHNYDNLAKTNKILTSNSLNSNLGSGKGKVNGNITTLSNHQSLFLFKSESSLSLINNTILKFLKITNLNAY